MGKFNRRQTDAARDNFEVIETALINKSNTFLNLEGLKREVSIRLKEDVGDLVLYRSVSGKYFLCQNNKAKKHYEDCTKSNTLERITVDDSSSFWDMLSLKKGFDCSLTKGHEKVLALENKDGNILIYTAFTITNDTIKYKGENLPKSVLRKITNNKEK